jgi:hypothetical protein
MFTIKSARDLGVQFTDNPHRMVGQDGAYSIPLNGETLWFFGDTLVGSRVPGESLWFPGGKSLGPGDMSGHGSIEKLYTNTGLILRESTGRSGLKNYRYICDEKGNLRQIIPREPDEHPDEIRVWCLHGCALGKNLYLYYITVRMLAEGPLPVNFELVGSGLAVGDSRDWNFRRIPYRGTTLWWKVDLPQFGTTVLHLKDEDRIYLYGVLKDEDEFQRCYLARVMQREAENFEKYEYLISPKPSWGTDPRKAIPIMGNIPNEMSVSWNGYLGSYLAVHSFDLSGRIVGRTAPHPWGPWSEPVVLWNVISPKLDYKISYDHLIYAGKEHPELSEQNGRVLYLTYVEFEEYFPHLVEVALA